MVDGRIALAATGQGGGECAVEHGFPGFEANRFLEGAHGLLQLALAGQSVSKVEKGGDVAWAEAEGFLIVADSLFQLAPGAEGDGDPTMRRDRLGAQRQRRAVESNRFIRMPPPV